MSCPSLETLLADPEGHESADLRRHLQDCSRCAAEGQRLRKLRSGLRSLPEVSPAQDLWPELRSRLATQRKASARRRVMGLLAAAALLALLIAPARLEKERQQRDLRAAIQLQLVDLREASQLLESELRQVSEARRVVAGWRAEAIVELEDRLARLDKELAGRSPSREAVELWRQRLGVQDALIQVHAAPVSYYSL